MPDDFSRSFSLGAGDATILVLNAILAALQTLIDRQLATASEQNAALAALAAVRDTLGSPFQSGGAIGNASFEVTVKNPPDGTALVVKPCAGDINNILTPVQAQQSGTWTVAFSNPSLAVTGPLTDAQLRASAVPVSATAIPLPPNAAQETGGNLATIAANTTGAATSAKQDSIIAVLGTPLQAGGSVAPNADPTLYTIDPTPHLHSQRALQAIQLQILATPSGGFMPCEHPPF